MPATSALACLEKATATLEESLGFASAFGFDGQSGSQCLLSQCLQLRSISRSNARPFLCLPCPCRSRAASAAGSLLAPAARLRLLVAVRVASCGLLLSLTTGAGAAAAC